MQQKLKWITIQKKVSELIEAKNNPRKISQEQIEDLKKSLKKFGLVDIPVVDLDFKVLSGNQRLKVLQMIGEENSLIDIRYPNRKLTTKEAKEYMIRGNRHNGEWDFDILKKEFDLDFLLNIGFNQIELSKEWDKEKEVEDDECNVEKEIKKIKNPKTKLGDIIELGNHRIICGDSTDPDTLKRLFGNKRVSMIYSDPVYNLNIRYNSGIGGKQDYGGNVNDKRSFEEYYKFLEKSLECALSVSNNNLHVFYWCDQVYIGIVQEIYRKHNIQNKRVAIWLKNSQNPVPSVAFNKCYEPCVYGVVNNPYLAEDNTKLNEVLNKEFTTGNDLYDSVDIWLSKRLSSKNYEHATSKPITLHEKAIKRCTKVNDIILDSFLGSGSTLLCAEQLGRVVYGCELEPVFCDLIIKRWEAMTNKKSKTISYEKTKTTK